MLEVDHCNEEERRLSRKQSILQEWFASEWLKIETVLNNGGEYNVISIFTIS